MELQNIIPQLKFPGEQLRSLGLSSSLWTFAWNIFFFMESYHFMTHVFVLFRVRLLPRKDLVRNRYYFLIDTSCVFIVNFVLLQRLQTIAVLQIAQHLYYYITWDKSDLAKKVISWSSLEWQHLPPKVSYNQGMFEIVGTIFDTMVHLVNMYLLAGHLQTVEVVLGLALVHVFIQALLFNPRFAWSEPTRMPEWVAKRLAPLSKDTVPVTSADKLLGQKPIDDMDLAKCVKKSQ